MMSEFHLSVAWEAVRNATGQINNPFELKGCTNGPIFYYSHFQNFINFPNKHEPEVKSVIYILFGTILGKASRKEL